jgi:hypothetical protein
MILAVFSIPLRAQQPQQTPAPGCIATDRFFEDEVWAKVGERTCLKCHNRAGDASETRLLLVDQKEIDTQHDRQWLRQNAQVFTALAREQEDGKPLLLEKVAGGLDHGGGKVLSPDSTGYKILERFVRRSQPGQGIPPADESAGGDLAPFFDGVTMLSPQRLLRRVTLSLAGRLPTSDERAAVDSGGLDAIEPILDGVFREEAFFERLDEAFNDIFLTLGTDDVPSTILSYEHFGNTRGWTEHYDLSRVPEADRQRAGWALAGVYYESILREPLELINYIVRNDRPFTELATADYIMVSPYSARGYGIYEEIKDRFQNADPDDRFRVGDPHEYIPVSLSALKGRDGKTQESATGFYPHAGFLSLFHYLRRYPTTETNRNRLRSRMFYQHFLGVDIMQLAPRTTDASAVSAKYPNPTMQAPDCVVCHTTLDPVAGIFQDFDAEGYFGPRKDGWYDDMFAPGFEGEDLPEADRWRAPQWLGERVVKDPRFATTMVGHVYYILTGRKVLQAPEDIDSPSFNGRRRAYLAQRAMIERAAERLRAANFNLKDAFKGIIMSEFYRVDGLAAIAEDSRRAAELDDLGIVRLLAPEQLERKIGAIFGKRWGRLNDAMLILYGGIDSKTVTERNADPSGAMGAIQRLLANDVACRHVAYDFRLEPAKRRLFPAIEPDVVPGTSESDRQIREAIVTLHQRILGREDPVDHPEVERTFQLFVGCLADAKESKGIEPRESYHCGGRDDHRTEDPNYTVRAWRGVVTYLLRQHDFLYE